MEIGRITQLEVEPGISKHPNEINSARITRATHLLTIPCDTESIVDLLVKTDADWNEVLRFLAVYADKQGIHIASQTIADKVRERLGNY